MANEIFVPVEVSENRPGSPVICPAPAGWPNSAGKYPADELDLHTYAVKNPAATYFLRAQGQSMINAGIHDGDVLVVDRSLYPQPGKVVIAAVDGDLTVRRLRRQDRRMFLSPENYDNPNYAEIDITGREDAVIWGVVIHCLHKL